MIGRIIEVADDKRYMFVSRGFLVVQDTDGERKELGQIPLDDITAVIANAHGLSYSNNLLVALAERGAPFVLCAANHNAVGMLWPVDGHYQQAKRFDAQIAAKKPTNKRIWSELIKSKIQQQAAALDAAGQASVPVAVLVNKIRSGDPNNIEAQAARRYWSLLFGKTFRRDKNASGINGLLNYGYTIYRAATARAIIAAGLHPTIGVHHSNEGNPMRLVDDLMEPFRPLVDLLVWQMSNAGKEQVTAETKRILVRSLYDDMQTSSGTTPTTVCMQRLAISLAQIYLGEREELDLPYPALPLTLAASLSDDW
ncbi:MAG: type II CRISPR-associated endonuclease Cas1 [Gammaproteobacteria bacterium]|nr:type II CRISPR-associated endonuclease Cas1 [Gammaproteobacteria bacterium]